MKCPRCGDDLRDGAPGYSPFVCSFCEEEIADEDEYEDDEGPCSHLYNGDRCELCGAEHPQSLRDFIEENT